MALLKVDVDLALKAGRKADQAARVGAKGLLVDAGLIVETLHVGDGVDLREVEVALLVLGKQHEVVVGHAGVAAGAVGFGVDVDLAPDDGLDSLGFAGLVEIDCAVHDAVVGHGDGVHAQFFGAQDERLDVAGPVEQAVLGMEVEMNERLGHVRHPGADRGGREYPSALFRDSLFADSG